MSTAFSCFAFCEYLIASANMAFHWTCTLDFPKANFLIGDCSDQMMQTYEDQFISKNKGLGEQEEGQLNTKATTIKDKDI